MKAKRNILFRVLAGLGGLWMGFFLVFSGWQLHTTRENLLQETAEFVNQANESVNSAYRNLWLTRERAGLAVPATPQTTLKSYITGTLTNLRNGLDEVEFAYYNETGELMGCSGDYLMIECTVPSETVKLNYQPKVYMLMNIRTALPQEAAEQLMEFLSADESVLWRYALLCTGFWADGQYMVPKTLALYEAQLEEDGSIRWDWEREEEGNKISLKNGTLLWTWENQPEPQTVEGMVYMDDMTAWLANWPRHTIGQSHEDLQTVVLDRQRVQGSGSILEEGFVETDADVWLVAQGGVLCTEFYCVSRDDYDLYLMAEYQPSEIYTRQLTFNESALVAAGRIYPLKTCAGTLAAVGSGSLALFLLVGTILIWQLGKIYDRQMALEAQRRRTTNAMAHDLKTPMAAVLGYGDNLLEQTHPEKQGLYIQKIYVNIQRMDQTVGQMLELSRLESAEHPLEITEFPLGELCRETVEICVPRSCFIEVTGEAAIRADRGQIARVLENFLTNGVKHTPEGDVISVTVEKGKCTVFNPGEPIPEMALPYLWEPHFQTEEARSQGGSGLGLSIAREILARHGFTWGAENQENGVAFWFGFE